MFKLTGKRPTDLGTASGRLKPCPGTPNCVCSQDQGQAAIAPLAVGGTAKDAVKKLAGIVRAMKGGAVVEEREDYLRAEFSSGFFGFVDDVEFWAVDPKAVQVRSASRLGRDDFGVNRKRIEAIRSRL
jgi:uncharacterized protein (DUF1499 family)